MSDKMYLKDIIGMTPDGILTATVQSIGESEANKNGKMFRKVTFLFPSTGKTITEGVFEFNFKANLEGLKPGDTVEMKLEKGWPIYKILSRSITEGPQPSQSNTQQVRSEKVATQAVQVNDTEKLAYDYKLGLAGIVQSMIVRGRTDAEITGEPASAKTADEWVIWIRDKAKSMASGIPEPKHDPITAAEAAAAFAPDNYPG